MLCTGQWGSVHRYSMAAADKWLDCERFLVYFQLLLSIFFSLIYLYLPRTRTHTSAIQDPISSPAQTTTSESISNQFFQKKISHFTSKIMCFACPNDTMNIRESSEVWVSCKAAETRKKGYPCGLWLLLHVLAANCHSTDVHW